MKKIYITSRSLNVAKEILSKKFKVDINKKSFLKKKELIEVVKEYDAILTNIYDKLDSSVLSYKKRLKVISNYAVGLDNIDVEYAKKNGIVVFNLPHIVTNSTAELAFALLLSLVRKICSSKEYIKKGMWKGFDSDRFMGEELFGKTLGIIGFGRIGKAVAKIALGFGLNVIFFKRKKEKLEDSLKRCTMVSLDILLEESDYICLCVPLTAQTKNMIDLAKMKKMKKKPVLINIARGEVVKTSDLIIALKKDIIRGAALDVIDPEPISKKHSLLSFKNCLIVPHIGASTFSCRFNMSKKAAENILNFFNKNG
ncbi:MAG: hypothetical protein AMS24_02710 [Chlamydiae bacterium SM23_39]|nr:MAG: hypothetical protein AMS24_02710 [Chlamydiae bacterium SM23_39]